MSRSGRADCRSLAEVRQEFFENERQSKTGYAPAHEAVGKVSFRRGTGPPQNDRNERVAVPTEGDIGGPRVTARRVCADPVHVAVRELTPTDGGPTFGCSNETVVGEDAVVSTMSGAPRARPG
jgi:hypothetical protein